MTGYIDRYRAGEHEQVWSDLDALGPSVFEEPVHADAMEVARETMRRARLNIELLIERLETKGYRFSDTVAAAEDQVSGLDTISALSAQMAAFASVGAGHRNAHTQQLMDTMASMQSRFAPLLDKARTQATAAISAGRTPPLRDPRVFRPAEARGSKQIARLERALGGPLPLSLRAWYEEVGYVSLLGSHPVLNPVDFGESSRPSPAEAFSRYLSVRTSRLPGESFQDWHSRLLNCGREMSKPAQPKEQSLPDPLVIFPIDDLLDQLSDRECGDKEAVELAIAPDGLHKADISGDAYYITLPGAHADFRFGDWHKTGFVNYLRIVFQWGGFPGWERSGSAPRAEIAALTEGLLPI